MVQNNDRMVLEAMSKKMIAGLGEGYAATFSEHQQNLKIVQERKEQLEQAHALGFNSVEEMKEHLQWLERNGTQDYKEWLVAHKRTGKQMEPQFTWQRDESDREKLRLFDENEREYQTIWKSGHTWASLTGETFPSQTSAKQSMEAWARRLIATELEEAASCADSAAGIRDRNLVGNTEPSFDEIQRLVLESYDKGEFSYLLPQDVGGCGDGLLKFLMVELSQREGCENFEVAVNRVETAMRQLQELRTDLANAYLNPASPTYGDNLKDTTSKRAPGPRM